jgi:two-component system, chemotaxis family, sensor kinase CheA
MDEKQQARLNKVMQMFQGEAAEHLQVINRALLDIERGLSEAEEQQSLQEAYRSAHNIKGSARMVGLSAIEQIAHSAESVIQAALNKKLRLNANSCDLLYDALDNIEKQLAGENGDIEGLRAKLLALVPKEEDQRHEEAPGEPLPQEEFASKRITSSDNESIRVDLSRLDALIAQIGELQIAKLNADMQLLELREILRQMTHFSRNWDELYTIIARSLQQNRQNQLFLMLETQSSLVQSLLLKTNHMMQSMSRDTLRLGLVTDELRERVRNIRMLPFESIAIGFERAVRNAANMEGKTVRFDIIGADTELDKSVLEVLKDPLMHLLNNAVSHGIEIPEARAARGKSEEGSVQLRVQQRGNEVSILVSDDGQGFNLQAIKAAAAQQGLTENGSQEALIHLAFQAGVSTASELSTISGRGVGLDVVRTKMESIHGRIQVNSNEGEGTAIEIMVPTSLAITRSLLIELGANAYAIPIASIERIIQVENVADVNGSQMIKVNDQHIPLISLAAILEVPEQEQITNPKALVLATAEQRIAVLVSNILTEQELSVKPMGKLLKNVRHVIGAAMLGNGLPIIVLSPADILRSALKAQGAGIAIRPQASEKDRRHVQAHILVVDDSITTRTLEQNILEAAGYIVTTAVNGLEALRLLENQRFDVVISDVQMPLVDGFELTRRIREQPQFRELPIILVTSLDSREDKEKGMKSGADAYVVKRGFSQMELLGMIERFVEAD